MHRPEKILIKPNSRNDQVTDEIIRRVSLFDSTIKIVKMKGTEVDYPKTSSASWRWQQREKNLVLAHRTAPFLTTFASPGAIVERMGTTLSLCWQCPCRCEFCYLQTAMPGDHVIYTNTYDLHHELVVEPYVHGALLALWTTVSKARGEELMKIPAGFREAANLIREKFAREGVNSRKEAVELLREILRAKNSRAVDILVAGSVEQESSRPRIRKLDLRVSQSTLLQLYDTNAKYPPRINASEYTDLLALDHLCGHSNLLMNEVSQIPDIEITMRTKSAYVDEMIAHDGDNRVTIAMNFNTPHIIERYEHGSASLEERLEAAQKIQAAKGIKLHVVVEPVIRYARYERDYHALARLIVKSLDPKRIEDIAIGCVRYSGRLEARVKRNFPDTDLFEGGQGLLPLMKGDRRRYPMDERARIYRILIDEFRQHTNAYCRLAAETPEAWKAVDLDPSTLLSKSVQYAKDRDGKVTTSSAKEHTKQPPQKGQPPVCTLVRSVNKSC